MNAFSDANAQRRRMSERRRAASAAAEQKAKKQNKRGNWGVLQAVIWKWFLNTNTPTWRERKRNRRQLSLMSSRPLRFFFQQIYKSWRCCREKASEREIDLQLARLLMNANRVARERKWKILPPVGENFNDAAAACRWTPQRSRS